MHQTDDVDPIGRLYRANVHALDREKQRKLLAPPTSRGPQPLNAVKPTIA
ncbi:hypothetical protein [Streptomyces tailanensis]|nr:hypothetical protein [Streptomyces tailanensis]